MTVHNLYLQLKRMETALGQFVAMQNERNAMLAKTFGTIRSLLEEGRLEEAHEELVNLEDFYRTKAKG